VDTLGLIGGLAVLPATPTDWDGAVAVFKRVGDGLSRLARVWADVAMWSATRKLVRVGWESRTA
jgi:hypothetical protein